MEVSQIEVPTDNLKIEHVQELIVLVKDKSKTNHSEEFWGKVADLLWHHLEECLGNLDDQLLCATCFYSVLTLVDKKQQDEYMVKLLHVFGKESNSPSSYIRMSLPSAKRLLFGRKKLLEASLINEGEIKPALSTLRVVSLIYGMFQSSFLTQVKDDNVFKVSQILKEIFDLLLLVAYEYSGYTFLVFKIITTFKKVCGGPLEKHIFSNENKLKILVLVNNNWENPITGVRDLNRSIFQTLIKTLDIVTYESVIMDIESFYWNKAKFLMLSDIIEQHNENIIRLMNHEWINSLIFSLHKPGLVSAGADMYYAVLKKLNTQNDWCKLFLLPVLNILRDSCTKAIDNFCNYWCLTTIKKFRTILYVFMEELEDGNTSEQILYSKLGILKQANKLSILEKNVSSQSAVLAGIDLHNTRVRMLAFDIICGLQGKNVSSHSEYDIILDYICNNLNSDSTVLRISMLSSFNICLVHLHSTFENILMKNERTEPLENVCRRLQNLIIMNITVTGNYQRKITSLKLCSSVLTYFSTVFKKKNVSSTQGDVTVIDILKKNKCWLMSTEDFVRHLLCLLKDPTDEVRENVIKILLSYYVKELQYGTLLEDIVNDAKKYRESKYFYEISCGQSMYKLITNLLLKNTNLNQTGYRSVEDIFNFAYNELITQHGANTNVMNSILRGQQLHSYINILLVVLEECINNHYTLALVDNNKMSSLLQVLESVSNQFVWEEEGSSDFSKMNELIQNIINTSDYNSLNKDDDTKISGLYQIVLNCLWLNVKASCDLAMILIKYNVKDISVSKCTRCLNIITRVLETTRHKGAIEAAGAALGKAIHYLTSITDKLISRSSPSVDVSKLPCTLLKTKLYELISETNRMSSVTRRGAGLSIMLHRIVSNDMKKGKPLFHYFIKILLQKCKNPREISSVETRFNKELEIKESNITDGYIDSQVDLPAAIYIHFLTRIVTDSSLATDIMYYSTELAELAFGKLTSTNWQIRNAALQLYGALMPRLIGQKKASGTDDETIATVACDEMLTHSPKLWDYITEQLKDEGEDRIQTHSNLVPILNILASSAKRYHFSLSVMRQEIEIADLFFHLIRLLSSPIYTVRRMTAKAIFNMYEFEHICHSLLGQENVTENLLHGMLLLLNLCVKYYSSNVNFENSCTKLRLKFNDIFNAKPHSYLCKTLYEDIFSNDISMKDIENTIVELNSKVHPGLHSWAEARLRRYVNQCAWSDIHTSLNVLLPQCSYENYVTAFFEFILLKIEKDTIVTCDVLVQIANTLITFERFYDSSNLWKILYEISKKVDVHHCIDVEQLLNNMKEKLYNQRFMIPLIARHIEYASDKNKFFFFNIVNDLSDFENSDVGMRYIAAVANNEISQNFNKLSDSLKVTSIKCAVMLLQDEDEDVRNLSVNFYSNICREKKVLQPYICLNKILDRSFLNTMFVEPEKSIVELQIKISGHLELNHKGDEYNPFANDSKNIYLEPYILTDLVGTINV